ncbi:beta-lactamase [Aquimarina brevivitae]|uniref:Beta-lactamase n=2 Tax=Aquimarina brevivitae TaxID=323412 RepID=A0A4Q7P142_9FLAO|nr:beta-lactamase [Aquimarina brevivitae]
MYKIVFLFLAMVCFGCQHTEQKLTQQQAMTYSKIDEYFSALTKLKKFNGAVVVTSNGETLLNKAYSITKDKNSHLYVTKNHQFDIRSISKLVAKIAVLQLEQKGLIERSKTINTYLNDFPYGDKVTIQHLMDNTSGLPRRLDQEYDFFAMEIEETIALIKKAALEFEPGTAYRYSNLGYELLYYIIHQITGKPFVQYAQDEIFDPLEMEHTGAHFYSNVKNLHQFAYYHSLQNDSITEVDHFNEERNRQVNLYSTTSDLMKLMEYVRKEPFVTELQNEQGIIGHSGGSEGIRAHVQTDILKNYSFAFLCNYDEIPFAQIITDLENIIEEKPYTIPKPLHRTSMTISPAILHNYKGKYDVAEFNHKILEFRVENDSLVFYQDDQREVALKAENDSTFFDNPKSTDSFIFQKSDSLNSYDVIMRWKGVDFKGILIED